VKMRRKNKVEREAKMNIRSKVVKTSRPSSSTLTVAPNPQAETIKRKVIRAARKLNKDRTIYDASADLPWRKVRTPYRIFVAEFLLVRTRADIVARLFESIVQRYPDMHSLAAASEQELASALEPLGLRKRVPLLLMGARFIVKRYRGQVPQKVEELLDIPGIGAYTAVAVAAFAYGLPEVPADVNILRFLSRLTGLPMVHPTKGSRELWSMLPWLSPDVGGPAPEKLLDFSRLICRPAPPRCELCPVRKSCTFFASVRKRESSS
jgi:A/G-specific adenine glycosylase